MESRGVDLSAAEWAKRIASKDGPKDRLMRIVLLTLAAHMGPGSEDDLKRDVRDPLDPHDHCALSFENLAEAAGVSISTVTRRLDSAVADGWLVRERWQTNSKGWRRNKYRPSAIGFHDQHGASLTKNERTGVRWSARA